MSYAFTWFKGVDEAKAKKSEKAEKSIIILPFCNVRRFSWSFEGRQTIYVPGILLVDKLSCLNEVRRQG